jgi:hypothetical protein
MRSINALDKNNTILDCSLNTLSYYGKAQIFLSINSISFKGNQYFHALKSYLG